eukprot:s104_g29.t1
MNFSLPEASGDQGSSGSGSAPAAYQGPIIEEITDEAEESPKAPPAASSSSSSSQPASSSSQPAARASEAAAGYPAAQEEQLRLLTAADTNQADPKPYEWGTNFGCPILWQLIYVRQEV